MFNYLIFIYIFILYYLILINKYNKFINQERQSFSRSANVEFICGLKNEIIDIIETELCVYQIKISTLIACSDYKEKESLEKLEFLGVFGFKKQKKEVNVH
jgi:hypothetical protein